MYELEKEWQMAIDGFSAGIDFKEWLANQVLALRAAAQQSVKPTVSKMEVTCPCCTEMFDIELPV